MAVRNLNSYILNTSKTTAKKQGSKNRTTLANRNSTSAIGTMNSQMQAMRNNLGYFDDDQRLFLNQAYDAQSAADQFNAEQAEIQRNWSESMSATAHQREVADLVAAGLNPVISAYGSGASVGSGAAAQSSNVLTGVLGSLASDAMNAVSNLSQSLAANSTSFASTMVGSETTKYASELAAKTNVSVNDATNKMNYAIAQLNNLTSKEVAHISGQYGISRQQVANIASEYAADIAYAANVYSSDKAAATQVKTTSMNNATTEYGVNFSTAEGVFSSLVNLIGTALGSGKRARVKK